MNVQNSTDRPHDVTFALDQIALMNSQAGPLRGRIDMQKVGMAGHSYGAYTTLALAGQTFGPGESRRADPRVKAAVAMSTPVPRRPAERHYSHISIPILHMTGTDDVSPLNDTSAKDRRIPFDSIRGALQLLVTFRNGDHMLFSGTKAPGRDKARDAHLHDLICETTTAFWNAFLRNDPAGKMWLMSGGCTRAIGDAGVVEIKNAK